MSLVESFMFSVEEKKKKKILQADVKKISKAYGHPVCTFRVWTDINHTTWPLVDQAGRGSAHATPRIGRPTADDPSRKRRRAARRVKGKERPKIVWVALGIQTPLLFNSDHVELHKSLVVKTLLKDPVWFASSWDEQRVKEGGHEERVGWGGVKKGEYKLLKWNNKP